jgi:4-amino-4-deoxy-L-arabinose transferase-like glycosyltransferase
MSLDASGLASTNPEPQIDRSGSGEGTIRTVPRFVWLAALTLLLVALLGSLVLPQLRIPDEKHNADMVLMAQEGDWLREGWPGLDERRIDPAIIAASLSLGRRERALQENRAGQHPPFFYLMAAATSSLATIAIEEPDLALRLWTYRLISVAVTALLPITYYLIASELTSNKWVRLASALLPLCIPGITLRDGSMINTDALLMFLISVSILMSLRIAKGDLSLRNAVVLGVFTGLAALTKGHALFLIPVLVVAYLIPLIRHRQLTRQWLRSALVASGITLVVGGWWWIRNLLVYGMIQPVRTAPDPPVGAPTLEGLDWLTEATQRLVGNFWGGGFALGGRAYMPLFWILTIFVVIACIAGWLRSSDRGTSSVSSLYAVLLVASVIVSSAYFSSERGRVVAVHGRYFFPGLAGVAPLIALGAATFIRRRTHWLPTLFVVSSLTMTFLAIEFMLDQYWSSFGPGLAEQWSGVMASSPVAEAASTSILLLAAASLLTLLISAVLLGLRSEERDAQNAGLGMPAEVNIVEADV